MIPCSGEITIRMLADVKQATIGPLIKRTITPGTVVSARDQDGDGFCEVPVNTIEGFWSLLRFWLRLHRGISREKLPLYLGLVAALPGFLRIR